MRAFDCSDFEAIWLAGSGTGRFRNSSRRAGSAGQTLPGGLWTGLCARLRRVTLLRHLLHLEVLSAPKVGGGQLRPDHRLHAEDYIFTTDLWLRPAGIFFLGLTSSVVVDLSRTGLAVTRPEEDITGKPDFALD